MAPPKTPHAARGTIKCASSQNIVSLTIRAVPLPDIILQFILQNLTTLRTLLQNRNSTSLDTSDSGNIPAMGHSGMQGDVLHTPSVKPEQFWSALTEKCNEAGGEWSGIVDRIWAFGPGGAGGCVLIDARKEEASMS